MMNPEPRPARGSCSPGAAPLPGPPGPPGAKRRKNSASGSSAPGDCALPRGPLRALLVVMTFTTAGPSIFMSGVKSGSGTTGALPLGAGAAGRLAPLDALASADASSHGAGLLASGFADEVRAF